MNSSAKNGRSNIYWVKIRTTSCRTRNSATQPTGNLRAPPTVGCPCIHVFSTWIPFRRGSLSLDKEKRFPASFLMPVQRGLGAPPLRPSRVTAWPGAVHLRPRWWPTVTGSTAFQIPTVAENHLPLVLCLPKGALGGGECLRVGGGGPQAAECTGKSGLQPSLPGGPESGESASLRHWSLSEEDFSHLYFVFSTQKMKICQSRSLWAGDRSVILGDAP